MKFNTKTRYGLRSMVEIAMNGNNNGIYQKDIAQNQEISIKYLDHIIHGLKVAGLIHKKGKKGGYVLSRKSSEITVYDINNAFEPGICIVECLNESNKCTREKGCGARIFWNNLNKNIIEYLKSVTLEDITNNTTPEIVSATKQS